MQYKGSFVNSDSLNPGPWKFENPVGGLLFDQLGVADNWGERPSALGICPPEDDVPLMVAFVRVKRFMEAYENQENERKMEQERAKLNAKGKG